MDALKQELPVPENKARGYYSMQKNLGFSHRVREVRQLSAPPGATTLASLLQRERQSVASLRLAPRARGCHAPDASSYPTAGFVLPLTGCQPPCDNFKTLKLPIVMVFYHFLALLQ